MLVHLLPPIFSSKAVGLLSYKKSVFYILFSFQRMALCTLGYFQNQDEFGRPCITWMHNGTEIGAYNVDPNYSFTDQKTNKETYNTIGSALMKNEDYNRSIYVDGELVVEGFEGQDSSGVVYTSDYDSITVDGFASLVVSNDTTPFMETGAGVLTEVYVIAPEYTYNGSTKVLSKEGEIIITMVHTYLAEVTSVTEDDGEYTVTVSYVTKDTSSTTQKAWIDGDFNTSFMTTTEYTKDDVVMVTLAENSKGKFDIMTMALPEVIEGLATGSRIEPDVVGGSWVEVDGTQYDYAHSVRGNISDTESMAPTESTEIVVYLDNYGYVLGYDAVVPWVQYLYVEDKDSGLSLDGSRVRVTFADGTEDIITISYIDNQTVTSSTWASVPSSRFVDDNVASANETYKNEWVKEGTDELVFGKYLENRVYSYSARGDGTYELYTDIRKSFDVDGTEVGVLDGITIDKYGAYYDGGSGIHESAVNSNLLNTAEFNTMFIYTSVQYAEPTTATSDWDADDLVYAENVFKTEGGTTFYVDEDETSSQFIFEIEEGYASVLAQGATNGVGSNHIFVVDRSTVFVDVINNKTWIGYDNVPIRIFKN